MGSNIDIEHRVLIDLPTSSSKQGSQLESYSQHFIFFIIYTRAQQARVFVPEKPLHFRVITLDFRLDYY